MRAGPRARREGAGGLWTAPDGGARLVLRVSAPPADGRANAALIALIAQLFSLPKSAVRLNAGAKDRLKSFALDADAGLVRRRLAAILSAGGEAAADERAGGTENGG